MKHKNRTTVISVLTFVITGIALMGIAGCSAASAQAGPLERNSAGLAYHDEWRELWEDHITWTRTVILGILDELPGTDAYTERLLQNYVDMEEALRPYYREDAEALGGLIEEHLTIAAEMLTAAKGGDTAAFEEAKTRWYTNGDEIAAKMNGMNPEFWPLEETRRMWVEHLDATLEEATTHLNGDFKGEVAAYDQIHELALDMADFMSMGIMKQFPEKFQDPLE